MEPELTVDQLLRSGPVDPIKDPYSIYARLRRDNPVRDFDTPFFSGYFITRYDDVRTVLKDDVLFSNRSNQERGIGLVMGPTIIGMDGAEHIRHRSLITPALAPRIMRGDFATLVRDLSHGLIDQFAARGHANLVSDFTFVYPLRVFTEILGLPPDDVETFHNWAIDLTHVARDPERGLAGAERMREYLEPLVARCRRDPGDDLISKLATAEVDGQRLTEVEVISFVRLLVIAGAETTYHLLGSALFALLSDPELLELVRADRSKIDRLLAETLRWESPVQMVTREATADTTLSDVAIPAGKDVVVCLGSANRDETHFDDPDRFDIYRDNKEHLGFGLGRHYCAGSHLALLEARVGLEALLDRLPELRLDPDSEPAAVIGYAFRSPDHLRVRFAERPPKTP